jgi:hypothetical protein
VLFAGETLFGNWKHDVVDFTVSVTFHLKGWRPLTAPLPFDILPTVRMLSLARVPVAGPPQAHLSVLLRVLVLRSIRPPGGAGI